MICENGYTEQILSSGVSICLNTAGYTPQEVAANKVHRKNVAIQNCSQDLPHLLIAAVATIFLPGWWKIIPLGIIAATPLTHEGPTCDYWIVG